MGTPVRRTVVTRVLEAVQALALCHNVTPVYEDREDYDMTEADQQSQQTVVYQASSPDEVTENSSWVLWAFKTVSFIKWATSWENLFMPYANNKGTDQPVHPHSLISAFVVCCLDSIIPLLAIAEISRP